MCKLMMSGALYGYKEDVMGRWGAWEGGISIGSEHLLTSSIQIIDFTQIISPLWVYPKIDTTKKENDPYNN